ncbi:MAG TPA: type II secretion system minor pseudopilin GspJ [Sphingobium sp.]|uniref:type II secretion system minor pseudopilin GspJ n=1 Tax=Sphingobium sp. TaxID=1912891 RepID=UPI002ECFB6FC
MRRSAEHDFESSGRSAQQGFTLIELLVALLIFAMLSAAGVALLRGSVSSQAQVRAHLDRLADIQIALATLDSDLAQATVRISRTQSGTFAPAFYARAPGNDGPILQFVRLGWSNPGNMARPSVQKVEYWWRGGRIERVGYAHVDGGAPSQPAVLLSDVTALSLRFRDETGEWRSDWTPTQPDLMPRLVEMTITRDSRPAIVLRFLVGPGAASTQITPKNG